MLRAVTSRGLEVCRRGFSELSGARAGAVKDEDKLIYDVESIDRISGHATVEGTTKYSKRNPKISKDNWRAPYFGEMQLSRLGYGTYIGDPTVEDDKKMYDAIIKCVKSGGVNVIDAAINYRYMKSERVIGAAVKKLLEDGYSREELFICTKGGYITKDADRPDFAEKNLISLLDKKKIEPTDIVGNVHCMHPNYLENQLEHSLDNLKLNTVDLYYIHNPRESISSRRGRCILQQTGKSLRDA